MPLLCMKCDTRVEAVLTKSGTFWCPGCEKEIGKDDVYRVGKRYFASGIGMMMAMAATMPMIAAAQADLDRLTKTMPGDYVPRRPSKEAANTIAIAHRMKRKKIHGLRKKQKRHMRQGRR